MTGLPKDCPHCGESMGEVIAAEKAQRSGWYCAGCQTFIKAIGRERFLSRATPDAQRPRPVVMRQPSH